MPYVTRTQVLISRLVVAVQLDREMKDILIPGDAEELLAQ